MAGLDAVARVTGVFPEHFAGSIVEVGGERLLGIRLIRRGCGKYVLHISLIYRSVEIEVEAASPHRLLELLDLLEKMKQSIDEAEKQIIEDYHFFLAMLDEAEPLERIGQFLKHVARGEQRDG